MTNVSKREQEFDNIKYAVNVLKFSILIVIGEIDY